MQDETLTSFTAPGSSIIPEGLGGGETFSDKFILNRRPSLTRFGMMAASGLASGSMFSGLPVLSSSSSSSTSSPMSGSSLSNQKPSVASLLNKDLSSNQESPLGFSEIFPSTSVSPLLDTKAVTRQAILELPGPPPSLTLLRRSSTFAERKNTTFSAGEVTSPTKGSPKTKKTGAETGAELFNALFNAAASTANASEPGTVPMVNA